MLQRPIRQRRRRPRSVAAVLAAALIATLAAVGPGASAEHGVGAKRHHARLIVWRHPKAITGRKSANRHLKGTPKSFRKAMGKYGRMVKKDRSCGIGSRFYVERYDSRGYASTDADWVCDSYGPVWARVHKHWKIITSWDRGGPERCHQLHKYRVPPRVLDQQPAYCLTRNENVVRYRHR